MIGCGGLKRSARYVQLIGHGQKLIIKNKLDLFENIRNWMLEIDNER